MKIFLIFSEKSCIFDSVDRGSDYINNIVISYSFYTYLYSQPPHRCYPFRGGFLLKINKLNYYILWQQM